MKLEVVELNSASEISSAELRERAAQSVPGLEISRSYIVRMSGNEVAFVSYDLIPDDENLVLYELFVASRFLRQGIGSELIRHSVGMATKLGYRQLFVRPKPLAKGIAQEELVCWYVRRGFVPAPAQPGAYIKVVPEGESNQR